MAPARQPTVGSGWCRDMRMKADRFARRMPSRSFACKGVVSRTSAAHCMRLETARLDMRVCVFYVDITWV